MEYYEMLEHTADLGIRVWGKGLKELFINSASAMYSLIADLDSVKKATSIDVKTEAQDRDELLRNWLSELLYYFNTKEMLLSGFVIKELDDRKIVSVASGENMDTKRHNIKHEIKAVTFHRLNIKEKDGNLMTEVIFDV
jgi:SHS2 domain-containing protein